MKKTTQPTKPVNTPVAIIGIGCLFPKASGLKAFWRLLFQGIDAITDVPDTHWSIEEYFDTDPRAKDKIYCSRGGFLSPIDFDPTEYGIPPNILEATDTSQLLGLVAAKTALEDAGYGETGRSFNRDRTSVILGVTGTQELVIPLGARLGQPKWRKALKDAGVSEDKAEEVVQRLSESYVSWQENSFPGLLGNVVAGRICNRLDLGGTNCVVDAACASSMSAVHLATLELAAQRCDMVLTGGVDTLNDIFMHMCFGQTGILSPTGDVRPFSEKADGTLLGEGVGIIALKRLADAERDKDRIYAVIHAVGTSSDGRSQSIYAPRKEGQAKALNMAYDLAAITPDTIDLIEAHGTGTRVGDQTEFQTLTEVFSSAPQTKDTPRKRCALGAVKSMIGHTKAAAGTAGLIKTALALHHKTLPPTLKAESPDPDLNIEKSHFYLNTTARPWLSSSSHPRRSGVSAFGFGGSNFHVVMEEYRPDKLETAWDGSVEIISLSADTIDEMVATLSDWKANTLEGLTADELAAFAGRSRIAFDSAKTYRLLGVVDCLGDINTQVASFIEEATTALTADEPERKSWNSGNIYFGSGSPEGKLAFVFPGQGSQYINMGQDLLCIFPEALDAMEKFNRAYGDDRRVSDFIYPYPATTKDHKSRQEEKLRSTDIAQPAIGAISMGMFRILSSFGISPDSVCGHSYGELPALLAGGWLKPEGFCKTSIARGKLMAIAGNNTDGDPGTMLAVKADLEKLDSLVNSLDSDVILANRNSPSQGVLSGSTPAIEIAAEKCRAAKFRAIQLPVAAAFHSRLVADAQKPFRNLLEDIELTPTDIPVYSNTTGETYPTDPKAARDLLGNQIINPVDFVADIKNQYKDGINTFVEVGPKTVLTGLIRQILRKKGHTVMAVDASGGKKSGLTDLAKCLCHLSALGYKVQLDRWETPPPTGKPRKPIMKIPIGGANITNPSSKNRPSINKDSAPIVELNVVELNVNEATIDKPLLKKDPMEKQTTNKPGNAQSFSTKRSLSQAPNRDEVSQSLGVIQEGLRSMREIQVRTAKAHELFLETQAEAGRILESLVLRTRPVAKSSGITGSDTTPETGRPDRSDPTAFELNRQPDALPSSQPPAVQNDTHPSLGDSSKPGVPPDVIPDTVDEAPGVTASNTLAETLFEVVAELTGYPSEMLNLEMNIEADLGIDSIKRVEILSTMEERMPDLPTISPEDMGELKTLGQIVTHLNKGPVFDPAQPEISNTTPGELQSTDVEPVLFNVISELTGYPVEMLKPEMAIEADLGIDSIKRVEILSTMEERMPHLPTVSPEDMGELKTLGQIVGHLTEGKNQPLHEDPVTEIDQGLPIEKMPEVEKQVAEIKRQIVCATIVKSATPKKEILRRPGTIVISDDGEGLAEALAAAFSKQNITTAVVPLAPDAIKRIEGSIGGFIPILPAAATVGTKDIKNLFLLTQAVGKQWAQADTDTPPILVGVSRMDGAFGFLGEGVTQPMHGALPGLIKTAAMEWPHVHCRSIDVAANWEDPDAISQSLLSAVLGTDCQSPLEVGLHPDLALDEQYQLPLTDAEYPNGLPELTAQDVVVVSGGARGITAESVIALARKTGASFALLGRSPQPSALPSWMEALTDPAEIKKAILTHEFKSQSPSPKELDRAFYRHATNREIQQTLHALNDAGVRATYYSVDVTRGKQVDPALDRVRTDLGPITALIHGAGILRDGLIIDKKIDAFEAVFNTKVKGVRNLLNATKKDMLRYLALFSSVTARFGNIGQSDYAMANEVLNKIAQVEAKNRHQCSVTAINWGPWECGMVSPALKRRFEQRGVGLIPTQIGAECLAREMGAGTNGPVEVIIGCRINTEDKEAGMTASSKESRIKLDKGLSLSFRREVDLPHYPVLNSHVLDGHPVVPFALMTEWFGHGALHENPGLILHGIDDMRLLKGIRMDVASKTIRLMAGKARRRENRFEVPIELRDGVEDGVEVIHSRGRAILVESLGTAPTYDPPEELVAVPYSKSVDEVYETILFHGEHLHGLKKINGLTANGMVAEISTAPQPNQWMTEPLRSEWLADPLALDTAFQMASVWCYEQKGMVSLPSYTASYRQFSRRFPSKGLKVILEVNEVTSRKITGDFTFIDSDHIVVARLQGYEAVMDPSLYQSFKPHLTRDTELNKGRSAA